MRYFLDISYCGAPFHGWQRQPGDISVQQVIEDAMTTLLRTPTQITGAGRTDTGVNARSMPAHFDTDHPVITDTTFLRSLNALVRPHVVINSIRPVNPQAHARFDATSRTYRYFVTTRQSPFLSNYSWCAPASTDFDVMNEAAAILPTVSDFASFAKLHSDVKTTICKLTHAGWTQTSTPGVWQFEITADRFLRNMVRAIVGTLIEVGRHKISVSDFNEIINQHNRSAAGTSMPPHPLFLWQVTYPY